jgi:hypothetical protein
MKSAVVLYNFDPLGSRRMRQKGMLDSVQLVVYRIGPWLPATCISLLVLKRRRFVLSPSVLDSCYGTEKKGLSFISSWKEGTLCVQNGRELNLLLWQYLDVAQKILKSDKVLAQKCANVPNAVEESSCLMQADANFMYVGESLNVDLKASSER